VIHRIPPQAGLFMKNYLLSFIIFLIVVVTVTSFVSQDSTSEIRNMRWGMIGYFAILTLAFHAGLTAASKGKPQVFIRYYMGATSFKLFIHLGVILVFAFTNKALAVPFIVSFLIYYFFFTVFDVGMSWRRFRK
jgi:hypothetical protein